MSDRKHHTRDVIQIKGPDAQNEERSIVQEVPLTVFLNGKELITLLTTGDANGELAVGFLLSEGFLQNKEDLKSIRVDDEAGTVEIELSGDLDLTEKLWGKRTVTSGCGKGATFYHVLDSIQAKPVTSELTVSPGQVYGLMKELNRLSDLYRETRGVHNSALADGEEVLVFRDDIGRHNAVDKIRGACFLEDIPLGDKSLVTTGRMSSEIVVKVAKMGVPILISRSAPTSLALDLAERIGLTLIGYVRGNKMTVYTGAQRVLL
ncbi:MAG: formate dehydrogenase accessory sulfurtransferase FdhD [bacterium]|nr:formate dehydrogenase accessory sulfurtransferase FdhD [bacterium]MDT8366086.1 formate dehydrogenase accessory sulfurtransferase FdhD [bacterium]